MPGIKSITLHSKMTLRWGAFQWPVKLRRPIMGPCISPFFWASGCAFIETQRPSRFDVWRCGSGRHCALEWAWNTNHWTSRVCPHRDSCVLTWKGAWSPNILLAFFIVFFDLYGHLEGAIFSKKSLALNTAKKDLEGWNGFFKSIPRNQISCR